MYIAELQWANHCSVFLIHKGGNLCEEDTNCDSSGFVPLGYIDSVGDRSQLCCFYVSDLKGNTSEPDTVNTMYHTEILGFELVTLSSEIFGQSVACLQENE
jgi:hypothetical protein